MPLDRDLAKYARGEWLSAVTPGSHEGRPEMAFFSCFAISMDVGAGSMNLRSREAVQPEKASRAPVTAILGQPRSDNSTPGVSASCNVEPAILRQQFCL